MNEDAETNPLENTNVTERVNARLVRGDYDDYAQIAREEGTSDKLVAKQAYILKKDGRLVGDRRSLRVRQQTRDDGMSNDILFDQKHEQLIQAYRMMGLPEEDVKIMEAGHFGLPALKKLREDARALRHDKLSEEVAKEFTTLRELTDFKKFYRTCRTDGVDSQQYDHVMANVSESLTLEDRLEQQRLEIVSNSEILNGQSRILVQNERLENENSGLVKSNSYLQRKNANIEQFFNDVGEGKRRSAEISKIVSQEYDKLLSSNIKWKILIDSLYVVAGGHLETFLDFARALRANDLNYINAHGDTFGKIILETQERFRIELERIATEAARTEIAQSLRSGKMF
jgi:hypothetical protein